METIELKHGSGARDSRQLIKEVFLKEFQGEMVCSQEDAAVIHNKSLAFTTDSYIIEPDIFPGGDIGKLAICGTANDLAVRGATPAWFSAGFVIGEGYSVERLTQIVKSMASSAMLANISIVTGDTKVINSVAFKGIIINTSGVGYVKYTSSIDLVRPGDAVIISGSVGDHAAAILASREGLIFDEELKSDCSILTPMLHNVFETGKCRFARDATRGGVASILYEIAETSGLDVFIERELIPINVTVQEFCEILGLDPLMMANEGKAVLTVPKSDAYEVLDVLKRHDLGRDAAIIGELKEGSGEVLCRDQNGVTFLQEGDAIPRIC